MTKTIRQIVRHRRRPGTIVWPPRNAIRCHCLECMGYQQAEVRRCTDTGCHLWPYRLGQDSKPRELAGAEIGSE